MNYHYIVIDEPCNEHGGHNTLWLDGKNFLHIDSVCQECKEISHNQKPGERRYDRMDTHVLLGMFVYGLKGPYKGSIDDFKYDDLLEEEKEEIRGKIVLMPAGISDMCDELIFRGVLPQDAR